MDEDIATILTLVKGFMARMRQVKGLLQALALLLFGRLNQATESAS